MNNYSIKKIKSKIGKEYIRSHHYSKSCHNGPQCYGLFESNNLIGVCAFATPCSENVRASIFGPSFKDNIIELHRLFIQDGTPKNTESWFVSRVLKQLKADRPEIYCVISFADATEGHKGVIYQALNAHYYGTSPKATFYIDSNGSLRHPRQNGVNISLKEANKRGWKPIKREGKYRYCWFLPNSIGHKKWIMANCKLKFMDYPK